MNGSPEIEIRYSTEDDKKYLIQWLSEPGILKWFPMCNSVEIEDAAALWISYIKYKAVLTAFWNKEPCGIANLYLQPYQKLAHQALFAIIVGQEYRGKGVGTALVKDLMNLAKDRFKIELLHLEVYEGNPAIALYERLGFQRFGIQKRFIKEEGEYRGKIFMQKPL